MYLKLLGAFFIVSAAYTYGYGISLKYRKRVLLLEELLLGLEMFLAEVNYGLTPLPQAFTHIGRRLKDPWDGSFRCRRINAKKQGIKCQGMLEEGLEKKFRRPGAVT